MNSKHAEQQAIELVELFEAKRKELGISHQKLADATGLARSTISYVLNKKSTPTITVCFKISDALGIRIVAEGQ